MQTTDAASRHREGASCRYLELSDGKKSLISGPRYSLTDWPSSVTKRWKPPPSNDGKDAVVDTCAYT
jgi:hypothetical protein